MDFRSFKLAGLQGFNYDYETILRYMLARPTHEYVILRPLPSAMTFLRTFWERAEQKASFDVPAGKS